jgi:hypothetical protein
MPRSKASNLIVGNGSHSDITGTNIDLSLNSISPFKLSFNTSGNINMSFLSTNNIDSINTVISAANIDLATKPGVPLPLGEIISGGEIRLTTDTASLKDISHIIGDTLNINKSTPNLDFTVPEIQSYIDISNLTGALIIGGSTYTGNITGNSLDLKGFDLALNTRGNIDLAGLANTGIISTEMKAESISLGGSLTELGNLDSYGAISINHTDPNKDLNITGVLSSYGNATIKSISEFDLSGKINVYGENNTVNI